MAMTETVPPGRSSDRQGGRRRPFATLVKKLRNFKQGSGSSGGGAGVGDDGHHGGSSSSKRGKHAITTKKSRPSAYNNPYPESGRIVNGSALAAGAGARDSARSISTSPTSGVTSSATTLERTLSLRSSVDGRAPLTAGGRSMAPTVSTDYDAARSIAAPSHGAASSVTGTSRTATGGIDSRRGGDSTFSSPAPSVRSLTTTLTTIQSMPMPNGAGTHLPLHGGGGNHLGVGNPHSHHVTAGGSIHFNQPFPNTPASAIPAHLTPAAAAHGGAGAGVGGTHHPTTYSTATANGLLTDNASILTLASSSKRRRRRSLDTDASVRALPPSSLWGGSRESLPLSVLSASIDVGSVGAAGVSASGGPPVTPGAAGSSRMAAAAERASVYSAAGVIGDRNSFYAPKQPPQPSTQQQQSSASAGGIDGASVRSGFLGHGRAESVSGSIGGVISPLASPMEIEEQERDKVGKEEEEDGEVGQGREKEREKEARKDEDIKEHEKGQDDKD